MLKKEYSNFVRPTLLTETAKVLNTISGEEAKKLYLEEIESTQQGIKRTDNTPISSDVFQRKHKRKPVELEVSNLKLFTSAQNNNIDNLRQMLDAHPDKINTVDEYGWSLLMIACQANSVGAVEELLRRGIDTEITDKAGNSAKSLIIRNKNIFLANILLTHGQCNKEKETVSLLPKYKINQETFTCQTCDNRMFNSKEEHLSSTLHNLNASKGRKLPTNYVIPESNKGFQIMLKVGWDKETGLGPDGSGKKYPLKAVHKNDKKGLGLEKTKKQRSTTKEVTKPLNKKHSESVYQRSRRIEINFRREFY